MTWKGRLRQLQKGYARALAAHGTQAPLSETALPGENHFQKMVALAEAAGALQSPWCWNLDALTAARERLKRRAPPGKPPTGSQFKRDQTARLAVLAALPKHIKWESLHRELAGTNEIPRSWAGFIKLLDRIDIPRRDRETSPPPYRKMSPLELAYELGLVSTGGEGGEDAPRPAELERALERRHLARGRKTRILSPPRP
jgi:hypothetical protein